MSVDVRVESGRSGRLGAEVRLGSRSAIVDPRSGERDGKTSVQAEETGLFHRLRAQDPVSGFSASGGGWNSLLG